LRDEAREQAVGLEDVLLADDLGEPTRAHASGERLVGARAFLAETGRGRGREGLFGEEIGLIGSGHFDR